MTNCKAIFTHSRILNSFYYSSIK